MGIKRSEGGIVSAVVLMAFCGRGNCIGCIWGAGGAALELEGNGWLYLVRGHRIYASPILRLFLAD